MALALKLHVSAINLEVQNLEPQFFLSRKLRNVIFRNSNPIENSQRAITLGMFAKSISLCTKLT
jgi:hypothetical protein